MSLILQHQQASLPLHATPSPQWNLPGLCGISQIKALHLATPPLQYHIVIFQSDQSKIMHYTELPRYLLHFCYFSKCWPSPTWNVVGRMHQAYGLWRPGREHLSSASQKMSNSYLQGALAQQRPSVLLHCLVRLSQGYLQQTLQAPLLKVN